MENTSDTQRWEKMEQMLHEHDTLLRALYANSEKVKKYIFWGRVMSALYLLLIIAPLIAAIIYLPPLIEQYGNTYKELLNVTGSLQTDKGIFENLQDQLKQFEQGR
ncbi:MAG: hypothetical protein AB1352_00715 [Patescibacteria group bacterium]